MPLKPFLEFKTVQGGSKRYRIQAITEYNGQKRIFKFCTHSSILLYSLYAKFFYLMK
jgi:hypothetical protein